MITHGLSKDPLYKVMEGMVERCENPNCIAYENYGKRGISICTEWREDFAVFHKWAMANGYKKGLTIERINNNAIYEPSNCTFVTRREQVLNKRKRKDCTSGYTGVYWVKAKGKWIAKIHILGKDKQIGYYTNPDDAAIARDSYIVDNKLGYKLSTDA